MIAILLTVAAGILATAMMSATLYLIHWRGFAEGDMIRALGSLVTRNEVNAIPLGVTIHLVSGIVFAFLYVIGWSTLPLTGFAIFMVLGLITGFAHGLVVSFALVVAVAEHHPLPHFQRTGIGVAVAHLVAHVVYGFVVGLIAGAYELHLDVLPRLVS